MTNESNKVRAVLATDAGDITVEFLTDKAPKHVENFLKLASEGFYDGTRFHRVIPGFMIQGGDPNTKTDNPRSWGTGGPGYAIDAEFNDVHHERGVLSMARSADPNSAGSQFFVCHGEASFLDNKYTAFGRVVDGLDALDSIANAEREPASGGNDEGSRPVEPVAIRNITIQDA
ncbi:MAG: peptidyl-prolyl cis-trans isomerase B (cyclophilin B) [Chlamydiales bacterium]|jgi:peptidyl-prolyl cis-trans isomerase B (cyclophilin B)